MAVTRANVSVRISLTGDNKASATLSAAGKDLKALEAAAGRTARELARASAEGTTGFGGFKTQIGGALGKLGLVSQGLNAVASGARDFAEAIKEGAEAGDRLDILRRDIAGVDEMIADVKESTVGMFAEADITKAIANFRQFQIPLDNMDNVLEQVAKTSIRTGESAAMLLESITSGIARGSALRLDNLGILIKEEKVTRDYAESLGKEVDQLSQAERKAALLAESMKQLEANNVNVDLNDSRVASITRLETAFDDLWTGIKTGIADTATGFLEWVGILPERMTESERVMRDLNAALDVTAETMGRAAVGTMTWDDAIPGLIEQLNNLGIALGRAITADEAAKLQAQTLARQKELTRELEQSNERLAEARMEYFLINELAKSGAIDLRKLTEADEALLEAGEQRREVLEAIQNVRSDTVDKLVEQTEEEQRVAAEKAEQLSILGAQVADQERTLTLVRGASELELQIRDTKERISKLDAESVSDMAEKVRLLELLLGLETKQRAEAIKPRRRRGGRRRRRPEDEELADIIDLEEARLRLAGELNREQEEQLLIARATAKLGEIEKQQRKRKITDAKAANLAAQEELTLRRQLLDLEQKAAKERADEYERGLEAAKEDFRTRQEMREALGLEGPQDEFARRRQQITEAAEFGAITGEERTGLEAEVGREEAAAERAEEYERMAAGLTALGDAGLYAAQSQDEAIAAFGRLAESLQDHGDEITQVIEQIAAAQEKGADAAVGATASAIAVSGKLATAFVDDEQTKATILGLVETAAAVAAFAAEDYVGGALHTIAAALYFAAAGEAGGGAKASTSTGGAAGPRAPAQPRAGEEGRGFRVTVNINSPAAIVSGGGMQEAATQLGEVVASNAGTGFDKSAA